MKDLHMAGGFSKVKEILARDIAYFSLEVSGNNDVWIVADGLHISITSKGKMTVEAKKT